MLNTRLATACRLLHSRGHLPVQSGPDQRDHIGIAVGQHQDGIAGGDVAQPLRKDAAACWPVPATVPGISAEPGSPADALDASVARAAVVGASVGGVAGADVPADAVAVGPPVGLLAVALGSADGWAVEAKDPSACSISVIDGCGSPGAATTR